MFPTDGAVTRIELPHLTSLQTESFQLNHDLVSFTLSKEPLQTSTCGYPLRCQRSVNKQLQGFVNRTVTFYFAREESLSSVKSGKVNNCYSVLANWLSSVLPGKLVYPLLSQGKYILCSIREG
ncbi:hypothetical protein PGIGA_G00254400 [Pangasianodon gigas]|uniref:Uncharacterized protein n=1 Tax=Pangasianodon gigas TaxID=30993 RepID=A0ACC5WRM8_PANGG|nr:hypothetical protein [Pangasianodon gigas]